jgi:hypothetical protein
MVSPFGASIQSKKIQSKIKKPAAPCGTGFFAPVGAFPMSGRFPHLIPVIQVTCRTWFVFARARGSLVSTALLLLLLLLLLLPLLTPLQEFIEQG